MTTNFAIVGAAGYIAPRHLQAINETGCNLIAATDPHPSVGLLDRYSLDTKFFPETERFYRYIQENHVDWVSICSPNYLHSSHIYMALQAGANVLCEKPLVINLRDLDMLQSLEQSSGRKVYSVLQLRLSPELIQLRERLLEEPTKTDHEVELTYITARGPWYETTWKGRPEQSGGIGANIGIHLFDLMLWLFGDLVSHEVHLNSSNRMSGIIQLERARIRWFLSTQNTDLPFKIEPGKKFAHREILIDGDRFEFSKGFTDLHTLVYQETLAGRGFGIEEARPSIQLVHKLCNT